MTVEQELQEIKEEIKQMKKEILNEIDSIQGLLGGMNFGKKGFWN